MQDRIRIAAWYRKGQMRIFEALISVYATAIPNNPEIIKKVEQAIDDYVELAIPGSNLYKKKAQDSFVKTQSNTLAAIYDTLKKHSSSGAR